MELNDNQLEKLMQADINMREAIQKLENEISDIKVKRDQVQAAFACIPLEVLLETRALDFEFGGYGFNPLPSRIVGL